VAKQNHGHATPAATTTQAKGKGKNK